MPSLTISRSAEPPEDWREFALAHGTFYHHPDWLRCLGEMYRLRLDCYSARSAGELLGFLAVAEIPPLLGPRRLVSLPFSYAAGPLALDSATAGALSAGSSSSPGVSIRRPQVTSASPDMPRTRSRPTREKASSGNICMPAAPNAASRKDRRPGSPCGAEKP